MTTWFAPVGISRYRSGTQLPAIREAVNDLRSYIEVAFDAPEVVGGDRLDDGWWDRERVHSVLKDGLSAAAESDVVIVYWAGHGSVDGEHRLRLSDDRIFTRELADWLFNCPAATVVALLDCCGAGPGLAEVRDLGDKLKERESLAAKETRRLTMIAAGRDEDTEEGLLIRTMLDVLRRGPNDNLDDQDRWTESDPLVRADQLVAAVNERLTDQQQAVASDLRNRGLGLFFPSLWNQRARQARARPMPISSQARLDTERLLTDAGVQPPPGWTPDDLDQLLVRLPVELSDERRRRIEKRIAALRLALSAHAMIESVVDPDDIRADLLVAARRAAAGHEADQQVDRPIFDLLVEAASERVGGRPGSPVERLLRFAARLDHDLNRENGRRKLLFGWAREHGLQDSSKINDNIDRARKKDAPPILVIDLRNPPDSPADSFPRQAEGSFYGVDHDEVSSLTVPISPADQSGVEIALAVLLARCPERTVVHLLVPDQLLLFDAAAVQIDVNPYFPDSAGSLHAIEVHCDRTRDRRLASLPDYFTDAVNSDFPTVFYDSCAAIDGLRELIYQPPAIVLRFAPDSAEAQTAVLRAIWASPIVVWPVAAPADRDRFADALAREWPDLPRAARAARWRVGPRLDDHLRSVRLSWDDPDWLRLLKDNYVG